MLFLMYRLLSATTADLGLAVKAIYPNVYVRVLRLIDLAE